MNTDTHVVARAKLLEEAIADRSTTSLSKVELLLKFIGEPVDDFDAVSMKVLEVLDGADCGDLKMMVGAVDAYVAIKTMENRKESWLNTLALGLHLAADTLAPAGSLLIGYYCGEVSCRELVVKFTNEDWQALCKYGARLFTLRNDNKWIFLAGALAGNGRPELAMEMGLDGA